MNEKYVELTHKIVPTAVSFDLDKNEYVIGEKAKRDSMEGFSSAVCFKKDIGEPDSVYQKEQAFFITPDGDYQSHLKHLSVEEATKIYLEQLLSEAEHPDKIIIGIPTVKKESWIENYKKHIKQAFSSLGFPEPHFYWEPFAVFQYFRSLQTEGARALSNVLVIDIGGSTFNSCVVRTTTEGYVAQGGEMSIPRARMSEFTGGDFIDRLIVEEVFERAKKDKNILWKEEVSARLDSQKGKSILAEAERVKIDLCKKLQKSKRATIDLVFKKGSLNQLHEIRQTLNLEFMDHILYKAWNKSWCRIIENSLNQYKIEAAERKFEFKKFDAVILSGGSSLLPGLKEHIYKLLSQYTTKNNIALLPKPEYAVAQGIAYQIRELSERKPEFKFSNTSPCVVGDLFIGVRQDRGSAYIAPKVRFHGNLTKTGALISSPIEILDDVLDYDLELPFKPSGALHVGLFSSEDFHPDRRLNVTKEFIRIKQGGASNRKIKLKLHVDNGFVRPEFCYQLRGSKVPEHACLDEVPIDSIDLLEGDKYVGFDFGNSNSYVVEVLSVAKQNTMVPEYSLDRAAATRVKRLNSRLIKLRDKGEIGQDFCARRALDNQISYVYHSNKIEDVKISRGDTEKVLSSNADRTPQTKGELETKNLSEAYAWVLKNADQIYQIPKQFIAEINRTILHDVNPEAGEYRKGDRKPLGVDFEYPKPAFIDSLMADLVSKLSGEGKGNSFEEAIRIHTEFVTIHPFGDGNGRTARLLLTAILVANGFPNIILTSDQKERYISALISSNQGDLSALTMLYSDLMEAEITALTTQKDSESQISLLGEPSSPDNDPFAQMINNKYEEMISPIREIYQSKIPIFRRFISELAMYIASTEDAGKMKKIGFSIEFHEYDIVSEETFFDYFEENTTSLTWAFTLDLKNKLSACKILFAFKPSGSRCENVKDFCDVCEMGIYRYNGVDYVSVDEDDFAFDHIKSKDDGLSFYKNGEHVNGEDIRYFVSTFLASIFQGLEQEVRSANHING